MRRPVILLASAALVAAGLNVPVRAQEPAPQPAEVPATVLIEDPYGDANFLTGDNTSLPADGGSQTDIGKVWFSNDATNFQVHVLTEGPPSATSFGFLFEVTAGKDGCLVFQGYTKGTSYLSDNLARVTDGCNGLERLSEGTSMVFGPGPGGAGGLATITVPRSYSPLFTGGTVIETPAAETWIVAGGDQLSPTGYRSVGRVVDDTKPGASYTVTGGDAGETSEPVKPKPPGKGKPKGCDKGKGKKKGCKPAPPPAAPACPAMTPAEAGKDKPTITLTDAATEAAPLEQKVTLDASTADIPLVGGEAAHDAFNVVVDSAAAEAGFYALIEFPQRDDYDLNMLYGDGSYAARSRAWNTIIELNDVDIPQYGTLSSTGHGGESTASSEKLNGIKVSDCSGWTIDVANYLGDGGELTVKLWLGEAKTDPQEQGAEVPS